MANKKIVMKNSLFGDFLTDDTLSKYEPLINLFEAKVDRYTIVLKNNYNEIFNHTIFSEKEYNNTVMLLLDNSNNCVVAYCAFNCSNVKSSKGKLFPAIEIVTFAMNKDYCGETYVDDGNNYVKCSDYALEFYINYFKFVQKNYIYACIIRLHSDSNSHVREFYERNHFFQSPLGYNWLRREGESKEMYFFRFLDS